MSRRATVDDIHATARAMPHVTVERPEKNPVYPDTGVRYPDVIVFWVESEADKRALVEDPATPFFTTPHFDGHPSVLLRASRVGEMERDELVEVVEEAWLAQASERRGRAWLAARGLEP